MVLPSELPEEFRPYDELDVCSNLLLGGGVPILVDEHAPIVVGRGDDVPQVWISIPERHEGEMVWHDIVKKNKVSPDFKIVQVKESNGPTPVVEVVVDTVTIIKIRQESPSHASVKYLDLRPMGLGIHGDEEALKVAGNTISESRFEGVSAMVAVGVDTEEPAGA